MTWRRCWLLRVLFLLPFMIPPAWAETASSSQPESSLGADLLDWYSHGVFDFNRAVYQGMDQMLEGIAFPGEGILAAVC